MSSSLFILFVFVLQLFTAAIFAQETDPNGLSNFLTVKMRNYTTWLTAKGYDPSPINPRNVELKSLEGNSNSTDSQVMFESCILKEIRITGHSNKFVDYSNAEGNVTERYFFVNRTTTLQYEGTFEAKGTIRYNSTTDSVAFEKNGTWTMSPKEKFTEKLFISDFSEDAGHVVISHPDVKSNYTCSKVDADHANFSNLWNDNPAYETAFQRELATLFNEEMSKSTDLLISRDFLVDYLTAIFEEHSLEVIGKWPEPQPLLPTTTPSDGITSTTPTSSHSPRKLTGNLIFVIFITLLAFQA